MPGIGDALVKMGVISQEMLEIAENEARTTGRPLEEVLSLGFLIPEETIARAHAEVMGVQYVDLSRVTVPPDVMRGFDPERLMHWMALPFERDDSGYSIAVARPSLDLRNQLEKYVRRRFNVDVRIFTAKRSEIERLLHDSVFEGAHERMVLKHVEEAMRYERQGAPINTAVPLLLDSIINEAIMSRATDLHLVYDGYSLRSFLRVDGILRYHRAYPSELWPRLSAALKQRGGMDPADRLHPQDGHFVHLMAQGMKRVNIRTSAIPMANEGESIVLRILDESQVSFSLDHLGFMPGDLKVIREVLSRPHGLVLVTGPTGSGKTTTLYSIINQLKPYARSALTIEDPVEYRLPFVRQVQVNERAGRTPAAMLRFFLRHDPDVILVGEIRDMETAEIAMQAAETGHIVLSTLHTNDAPSAVLRLKDMGIDPVSIASTLRMVIAQRLVRVLCPYCKERVPPSEWELAFLRDLSSKPDAVYRAVGCDMCRGTGFIGRTVVYEIVRADEEDYQALRSARTVEDVIRFASRKGYRSMRLCGLMKVFQGTTTVGEVMRVCG